MYNNSDSKEVQKMSTRPWSVGCHISVLMCIEGVLKGRLLALIRGNSESDTHMT